jgi:rhodanese-related sulfurtransferase
MAQVSQLAQIRPPQQGLAPHHILAPSSASSRKQVPVNVEVMVGPIGPNGIIGLPRAGAVYVPPHCPNRVPTVPNVEHLDPLSVFSLLQEDKCLLIDLRGEDRAAGLIEGAMHIPAIGTGSFLSRMAELARQWADQSLVIFACQYSAHRAPQCANWYRQQANPQQRVAILAGGFRGWEAMGLPVQPLLGDEEVSPQAAQARANADEVAMQLGTQFVQNATGQAPPAGAVVAATTQAVAAESSPAAVAASAGPAPGLSPPASQAQVIGAPVATGTGPALQGSGQPQPARQTYVPPPCPNRVPTVAGVEHLDPATVFNLLQERRALLVDLRGDDGGVTVTR